MPRSRPPVRPGDKALKLYALNPQRLRRSSPALLRSLSRLSGRDVHIDVRRSELVLHGQGPVNLEDVRAILRGHRICTSEEELEEMEHRLHDLESHLGDD